VLAYRGPPILIYLCCVLWLTVRETVEMFPSVYSFTSVPHYRLPPGESVGALSTLIDLFEFKFDL
jgi:hypothetical protein